MYTNIINNNNINNNNNKRKFYNKNNSINQKYYNKHNNKPIHHHHAFTERSSKRLKVQHIFDNNSVDNDSVTTSNELSKEQKKVLDKVLKGENVFFTGAGGCGKSYLLQHIIRLNRPKTFVTSSTGISAIPIGGITIHSFAGIFDGTENPIQIVNNMSMKNKKKWNSAKVLIIDEISMLTGEMFTKIEYIARTVRRTDQPFGGIQIILCGDFLQLPPISKPSSGGNIDFCFQTRAWTNCFPPENQIMLTSTFRQKDDCEFIDILSRARLGKCTESDIAKINSRVLEPPPCIIDDVEISILKMYSRVDDVANENFKNLEKIDAEPIQYMARDEGEDQYCNQFIKNCQAQTNLTLKMGCEVMLIRNWDLELKLVNGSRGKIVGFQKQQTTSDQQKNSNNINSIAALKQTTTTTTGSTSSSSKKKSSDPSAKIDKKILHSREWPVVQFENGERLLVTPVQWEIKIDGAIKATRIQVPLMLASAITIHKTQGMTLDRAQCSLHDVFAPGQAYVGLSRLRSLDTFFLNKPITLKTFKAHPAAVEYYEILSMNNTLSTSSIKTNTIQENVSATTTNTTNTNTTDTIQVINSHTIDIVNNINTNNNVFHGDEDDISSNCSFLPNSIELI